MQSRRLRIGVNAAFLGRAYAGLNTYVRGVLEGFCKSPHFADIEFVVYTSRCEDVPVAANFIWHRTPALLCHENGTLGNSARLVWTQTFLPLLLMRDEVDTLLAPLPESPIWSRSRTVVVVHDLIPLIYPEECPRYSRVFHSFLPRMLSAASSVICVSHHTKRDLLRLYNLDEKQVSVIYNGVANAYFVDDGIEDRVVGCPGCFFLYVGTDVKRKNAKRVLEAFAAAQDCVQEDLVLVLSSPLQCDSIYTLARNYDLTSRIHVYCRLTTSQLAFLYRHATANILLSEYEGFGYPPAEALATGTPSIVSAGTSLSEVVADAGIVVDSGNLPEVRKAMIDLSSSSDFAFSLRTKALQSRERFRWNTVAARWKETLLPVAERNRLTESSVSIVAGAE